MAGEIDEVERDLLATLCHASAAARMSAGPVTAREWAAAAETAADALAAVWAARDVRGDAPDE